MPSPRLNGNTYGVESRIRSRITTPRPGTAIAQPLPSPTRPQAAQPALSRVSPLAVPILLEIGRESVAGNAAESLLREAAMSLTAGDLIAEVMAGADPDVQETRRVRGKR